MQAERIARHTTAMLFEGDGSKRPGSVFVEGGEDGLILHVQRRGELAGPGLELTAAEARSLAGELEDAVASTQGSEAL